MKAFSLSELLCEFKFKQSHVCFSCQGPTCFYGRQTSQDLNLPLRELFRKSRGLPHPKGVIPTFNPASKQKANPLIICSPCCFSCHPLVMLQSCTVQQISSAFVIWQCNPVVHLQRMFLVIPGLTPHDPFTNIMTCRSPPCVQLALTGQLL